MKIGYEISFNRYFYKPEPMRTLEETFARRSLPSNGSLL